MRSFNKLELELSADEVAHLLKVLLENPNRVTMEVYKQVCDQLVDRRLGLDK